MTPSSRCIRPATIFSRWLHERGDNYLDARRLPRVDARSTAPNTTPIRTLACRIRFASMPLAACSHSATSSAGKSTPIGNTAQKLGGRPALRAPNQYAMRTVRFSAGNTGGHVDPRRVLGQPEQITLVCGAVPASPRMARGVNAVDTGQYGPSGNNVAPAENCFKLADRIAASAAWLARSDTRRRRCHDETASALCVYCRGRPGLATMVNR